MCSICWYRTILVHNVSVLSTHHLTLRQTMSLPALWRRARWPLWGFVPADCRRVWSGGCWWWDPPAAQRCTLLKPECRSERRTLNIKNQQMDWEWGNILSQSIWHTFSKSASDLFLLAWATRLSASVYRKRETGQVNAHNPPATEKRHLVKQHTGSGAVRGHIRGHCRVI